MLKTPSILLLGLALACGPKTQKLGAPRPAQITATTLEDLLQHPDAFKDKVVAIEGRIGAIGCTDCGGVLVSDKTWRLSVEPEDPKAFSIPAQAGARIQAWGRVQVEQEKGGSFIELKARGVEIR